MGQNVKARFICTRCGKNEIEAREQGCERAPCPMEFRSWLGRSICAREGPVFWIESGAGLFTLAGMYLGSTLLPGITCYVIAAFFWGWLVWLKRLWGLIPLQVGGGVVIAVNLWRVL